MFQLNSDSISSLEDDYKWERKLKDSTTKVLTISKKIFDDDDKLKYFKATDWEDNFVKLEYYNQPIDDELPF